MFYHNFIDLRNRNGDMTHCPFFAFLTLTFGVLSPAFKGERTGGPELRNSEYPCSKLFLVDFTEESENPPWKNEAVLREKYVARGLSTAQIAKEFSCSKNCIRDALIRFNIPRRSRQQKGRASNPKYGTRPVKGHRVDYLSEQRVIRTIVDMKNDDMSFRKIAEFLTKVGIPTKTRRKKWHGEVVRQIYLNATEGKENV